ncbi:MAG: transketolase [Candidatus Pacebacteria bacterium]|nr:transketolase [Candidatus Paceibacterota bacterium]
MTNTLTTQELEQKASLIRQSIIKMLVTAGSGHTAGPLGMADVFTLLYFNILRHNPKDPHWADRDRLVLSNGHICPVQYAAMAHSGYFDINELQTLRKFGSRLQGHPHREYLPGIEVSSGPLGSGLSQAVGMALSDRMDNSNSDKIFYCLMGDGELNEGQVWEAALCAGKEKLSNIIGIIDRNHIQIDGRTDDVMPLEPLASKWGSFNWHVQEVDGHDFMALENAINSAKQQLDKPNVIIANTIPGKGVREIEGDYKWHGKPPTAEEGDRFLKVLHSKF